MALETYGTTSAAQDNDTGNAAKDSGSVSAPALVPLTNAYLDDISRRIRSRPIPWEGYARADLVTQEELRLIRSVDDKREEDVQRIMDEQGEKYAALYVRLLAKLTRTDTLQQILLLTGDVLEGHDERTKLFLQVKAPDQGNTWPWHPLLKLLEVQDEFCQLKAAQFLTQFLVYSSLEDEYNGKVSSSQPPAHILDRLLTFFSALINSGAASGTSARSSTPGAGVLRPPSAQGGYAEGNGSDVGIQLLEALLRSKKYRALVWQDELRKMGQVENGGKVGNDDDDAPEGRDATLASESESLLSGLRAILLSSLVPKSTPGTGAQSASQSGTSTPTARGVLASSSSQSSQGTRIAEAASKSLSGQRTPVGGVGVQLVYQVVFCLWLLSFDADIASDLNVKFGFVPILVDVARNAVKEKVVRIVMATLRNLVDNAPSVNTSALLGAKGLQLMNALAQRKYSDEEIPQDIEAVKAALTEKLKVMSNYDQFISELASGRLTWDNPAHSLDDFWKENTTKLLEAAASEDFGQESGLGLLLNILKNADGTADATTLAVACHDVGKMLQCSPEGTVRKRVEKAGGKAYIMALISNADGQVKFYALNTVSKLVSASWRG